MYAAEPQSRSASLTGDRGKNYWSSREKWNTMTANIKGLDRKHAKWRRSSSTTTTPLPHHRSISLSLPLSLSHSSSEDMRVAQIA